MKIGFDSNIFTMQRYGGVSRYMVRLGEELGKTGHEVRVHGWLHKNRHLKESEELGKTVRFVDDFPPRTRRLAHWLGDLVASRNLANWQPDLLHESFCHSRMVGPRRLARVCTIHDLIYHRFPEYRRRINRIPDYQQSAVDRADAVICVSESTRQDLLEYLEVDPGKVFVVHHGFELPEETTRPIPAEIEMLNDLVSTPYLLYLGDRGGYKNFRGLLQGLAASGLKDEVGIVAFGGGVWTARDEAEVRELGFREGMVRHGCGSDAVLKKLYAKAVAFVYPSLYEGFGFPPLEAMAFGCPVIASNTSSMPEVIGEAAEFFDPTDSTSIEQAIRVVVGSEDLRAELARLGGNRLRFFSWSRCAAETEQVYKYAISRE